MSILPFLLRKTSYHVQTATVTATVKIKVWFNLKKLWQKYITECNDTTTTTTTKIIIKTLFEEYLPEKLFTRIYLPEKCKHTT